MISNKKNFLLKLELVKIKVPAKSKGFSFFTDSMGLNDQQ
jgi:hypothetical protein